MKTIVFILLIVLSITTLSLAEDEYRIDRYEEDHIMNKYEDFLISLPEGNREQWEEIDQDMAIRMFILNYECENGEREKLKKYNVCNFSFYDSISGKTFEGCDGLDQYFEYRKQNIKLYKDVTGQDEYEDALIEYYKYLE